MDDPPVSSGCVQVTSIPPETKRASTPVGIPGTKGMGVAVGLGVDVGVTEKTLGVGGAIVGLGRGVGVTRTGEYPIDTSTLRSRPILTVAMLPTSESVPPHKIS